MTGDTHTELQRKSDDLMSVCLYVRPNGIAAVPKSLLSPGVGCQ